MTLPAPAVAAMPCPVAVALCTARSPCPSFWTAIPTAPTGAPCASLTLSVSGTTRAIGCEVTRMVTGIVWLSAAAAAPLVTMDPE